MEYTVDYFIKKFEAIPEYFWQTDEFGVPGGPRCAYGHCGLSDESDPDEPQPPEAAALEKILGVYVACINDGQMHDYKQPTPKQRILAALRDKLKEPANDPSPNEVSP